MMSKPKKTKKYVADSLKDALMEWVLDTQKDDDNLEMWVHDGLVRQLTAACLVVIDSCRESQQFTRDNES